MRINVCPQSRVRTAPARRSLAGSTRLPGKDGKFGPTGVGGVWIRIGPIKFFLDGGMLNGTAYMRQPWPKGETYQITEDDYRGLLFVHARPGEDPGRGGRPPQMVGHRPHRRRRGDGRAARRLRIRQPHRADQGPALLHHARQLSQRSRISNAANGSASCADVQPAWLYKDGDTLTKVLGKERMRWFQPYKSWLKYTTIGGGSDHMIKLDPRKATNPWDPWLGIADRRLAQARIGPGPRAGRMPDPRGGAAAVHDQQRLSGPRGEGQGDAGTGQARAT